MASWLNALCGTVADRRRETAARSPSRVAAACLIAVLATAQAAPALDPEKAFHQFRLDAWHPAEGPSQGTIIAIAQTADGYLWLGGYRGLDRFDGVHFTSFNHSNTPALRNDNVFALAEGQDGSLWIGTDGGGVARHQDGGFTAVTTADGLADDRVLCLLAARDGSLWIGTKAGLSRLAGDRIASYRRGDGLPNNYVSALAEDPDGGVWIGTQKGLARLEDGTFSVYGTRDGLAGDEIGGLAVDRRGGLWIGSHGAALSRYRGGVFSRPSWDGETVEDAVSFLEDSGGNLWVGTYGGGLYRIRGDRLSAYGPADGLTSDLIWALVEDREGSLWLGTEGGGLMRLRDTALTPVTTRDGLPHDRIMVVYEGSGGLWIGTDGGGLARLVDGAVTSYTARDGLASDFVSALVERRDGSLWIGSNHGVNQLRQGRITSDFAAEVGAVPVKAVFEDRQDRLWIGTDGRGLLALEGDSTTRYSTAEGLPGSGVRVFAENRDGDLWIGTDGGLARIRDGELTAVAELAGSFVRAIHEDPGGALWIGTRGSGLFRIEGGGVTAFTTRDGLYDDSIYQILEDDRGNLWMSCNQGIFRVDRRQLEAFARGEVAAVESTAYGTADGMKTSDVGGGSQPAGWKTRDGKLWFPTSGGLVVIDPSRLETNRLPPPVYVERVISDGSAVAGVEEGASLTLRPGRGELDFHFTALSYLVPERVRFRYRLEGYDDGWVDAGTRRSAYYTNLPPGRYRFRVVACNNDGLWNETGASVSLRLASAFYQTWIFYLACALAAVLAARGLHRLRVRGLVRRNQELERLQHDLEAKNAKIEAKNAEVQRFTYAVSHDLKSPLVTVLGFLGFLERDLEKGDGERVAADVERIRNAATKMQHLLDELLELSRIGRMDGESEPVDLGELAFEAIELVSGRIAERGVEVEISSALPVVSGDRARLLQLFQNLIDNAVKFMGDESEPRIEIGTVGAGEGSATGTVCFVRDNGSGIAPDYQDQVFGLFNQLDAGAEGAGMGLALVRRIVEVHGGRIWLESEGEGEGCTFFFTLPTSCSSCRRSAG